MSPEETEFVAIAAAERLNQYQGKERLKVVIPLKGFSSLSVAGKPLHDPAADRVFASAIKARLDPAIELIEVDSDINSPVFAKAVASALSRAMRAGTTTGGSPQHD